MDKPLRPRAGNSGLSRSDILVRTSPNTNHKVSAMRPNLTCASLEEVMLCELDTLVWKME